MNGRVLGPSCRVNVLYVLPAVTFCYSSPCMNGGTCEDDRQRATYSCRCLKNWYGDACEHGRYSRHTSTNCTVQQCNWFHVHVNMLFIVTSNLLLWYKNLVRDCMAVCWTAYKLPPCVYADYDCFWSMRIILLFSVISLLSEDICISINIVKVCNICNSLDSNHRSATKL